MKKENLRSEIEKIINEKSKYAEIHLNEKLMECRVFYKRRVLNPWELLEYFDIKLLNADLKEYDVCGFFKINDNLEPEIYCDEKLNQEQMRFVIMQEIIYKLLLDYAIEYLPKEEKQNMKNIVLNFTDNSYAKLQNDNTIQKLCNKFAIEAIMPNEKLQVELEKVAEYFGVEPEVFESYCLKKKIKFLSD